VEAEAMLSRHAALTAVVVALLLTQATAPAAAKEDPVYTATFSSLAVGGYDPVDYFTVGKPVEGRSEHEVE
jgi:hypothetical protein